MKFLTRWFPLLGFRSSADYWEKRYRIGGDSGGGSYGEPATYKAGVLNRFVTEHAVGSVIEFGCGDGHQLGLAEYPAYLGVDVSASAVERCRARFAGDASKRFVTLADYAGERASFAMSLDVVFHLVEDEVYDAYLDRLFTAADLYVVVYSTSVDVPVSTLRHVRHRPVASDVAARFPGFRRMVEVESGLPPPVQGKDALATRFFFYERVA